MDAKDSSHHCPYCCPHCQKKLRLPPMQNLIHIQKAILLLDHRIKLLEDKKAVKFR